MGKNRTDKIEGETDACHNTYQGPNNAKHKPQRTHKLDSGEQRKISQRDTYNFVDLPYYLRVAANLHDA